MEEILSSRTPLPITPEQEKDIDPILADARDYYQKKGFLQWKLAGGTLA
jgi:hypothetical protein